MDGKGKNEEPKIIAEFRIVDSIDTPTPQEIFVEEYNSCPLCGSELSFTHVTHFIDQYVNEEASCDGCNIKVKNASHRLQ